MDISPTALAGTGAVEPPRHVPDLRPTSDAAAIARNPRPDAPLGVFALPPVASQAGAVAQTLVSQAGRVTEVERVLKPYGIQMLPAEDRAAGQGRVTPDPDAAEREPGEPEARSRDPGEDPPRSAA